MVCDCEILSWIILFLEGVWGGGGGGRGWGYFLIFLMFFYNVFFELGEWWGKNVLVLEGSGGIEKERL